MTEDILSDTRETLVRHGLDEGIVTAAITEVRRRWGNAECYVRSIDRPERDRIAREALAGGATLEQAAKLAGCSTSTVRRRVGRG